MAVTPTAEQEKVVLAFGHRQNIALKARAGTGKTSSLVLLAESAPTARGLYIAFNKAIATDAATKFPRSVDCRTAHSLAYRAVGWAYRARMNGPRQPAREIALKLGIREPLRIDEQRILAPQQLARLVMDAVKKFTMSAEDAPDWRHVGTLPGLDDPEGKAALRKYIAPLAVKAWADIVDTNGSLPFSHDCYLKIWALSKPRLPYDYLLVDEAQDTNPALWSVVKEQLETHMQVVMVGDEAQAIYAWRGAVDAMSYLDGEELFLSQSFRFGPAIAGEANKFLSLLGSEPLVTGFDQINSRVEPVARPDAILCRTNAGCVREMLAELGAGRKVALVGGGSDIEALAKACAQLRATGRTDHPELMAFRTWGEVQDYVQNGGGEDLASFVKLVDDHGPDVILDTLRRLSDERSADVTVSTAHKSKGREWAAVRIAGDFKAPGVDPETGKALEPDPAELKLCYVAVTRAMRTLDPGPLSWINGV